VQDRDHRGGQGAAATTAVADGYPDADALTPVFPERMTGGVRRGRIRSVL
jgi:hypothetical protein